MGGSDIVLDEAKIAHAAGDHQFAAELAQLVVRSEPENEDGRLVKAAALRALGYQQLNPIARSWYLTGALELEGAIDPALVLGAMTEMLAAEGSTRDAVAGWRYVLDAERAGRTRLTVGIRVEDTGEEFTVRLRNSIIVVEDGIAGDADATVEATPALLAGMADAPAAVTLSGDTTALGELRSLLDCEMTGFYMHQR